MQHDINPAEAYENACFTLSQYLFAAVLQRDSQDPESWKRRIKTFEVNGLLSFLVESPVKARPIEVDESRLEDPRYRRHLVRKLRAPRPGKHMSVHVVIDRGRLTEPQYLADMSKLLAYRWTVKMLPVESPLDKILLLKQDVGTLTRALDTMQMHQSDGKSVAGLIMRMLADDLVDNNETMKAVIARMESEFAVMRAEFSASIRATTEEILAEAKVRFAEIVAQANATADRHIEEIKKEAAESQARTDQVLAECAADADPEESWRKAMEEAERKRKEANRLSPRTRLFLIGAGIVVSTLAAFHLDVDGVTAVEAIDGLIEYVRARQK